MKRRAHYDLVNYDYFTNSDSVPNFRRFGAQNNIVRVYKIQINKILVMATMTILRFYTNGFNDNFKIQT